VPDSLTSTVTDQAVEARTATPVLRLRDVHVRFPVRRAGRRAVLHALRGVDLDVHRGRTLGLVGESGSGKSTLASVLVGLRSPSQGEVTFTPSPDARRSTARQMVFQDPGSSLNPRTTVRAALEEPLRVHRIGDRGWRARRPAELLDLVGLAPGTLDRYPHELSGGQKQRVAIARALSVDPDVLVADEATSALDVSVQAQVLALMVRLRDELGLTMVVVSHDLSVVQHVSDEVAVLYLGRVVEQGRARDVLRHPAHPYTQALVAAVPDLDPRVQRGRRTIGPPAEPPDPASPPAGCSFRARCPRADRTCADVDPVLVPVAALTDDAGPAVPSVVGRVAACHHLEVTG
jgi:oligopeptide transport system ATP-binding protein